MTNPIWFHQNLNSCDFNKVRYLKCDFKCDFKNMRISVHMKKKIIII